MKEAGQTLQQEYNFALGQWEKAQIEHESQLNIIQGSLAECARENKPTERADRQGNICHNYSVIATA